MRPARLLLAVAIACLGPAALFAQEPPAHKPWWQRGADTWYYKDDWRAQAITPLRGGREPAVTKTLKLPAPAVSGWIVVWGDRGYRLTVNGKAVGESVDGCLIDDYDLTKLVAGRREVTIRIDGRKVAAEGEIVDAKHERHSFLTGADWQGAAGGGVRAEPLRPAPSTGAYHRAHNARVADYSPEQHDKAAIATGLARVQRLEEQALFLVRRHRPAGDILRFLDAPWAVAQAEMAMPLWEARADLREAAAASAARRWLGAAGTDARLARPNLAVAEGIAAATIDMHRARREVQHLANVLALLGEAGRPFEAGLTEIRRLERHARRAQRLQDWGSVSKTTRRIGELGRALRREIESAAADAGRPLVGGVGQLDEFPEDRFAWLNARELMGSLPTSWPFCVWPSGSDFLDLSGRWDFRIDPNGEGERAGWATGPMDKHWREIRAPLAWERQGVTRDVRKAPGAPFGKGVTGCDKPYNGFAWYRKRLGVPGHWKGKKLLLALGPVENWCRVFLNGKPIGTLQRTDEDRRLASPQCITVPNEAVDFGKPNTIALQVYNHDNFGGIVAGPLALTAEGPRDDLPNFDEMPWDFMEQHAPEMARLLRYLPPIQNRWPETPGPLSRVLKYQWHEPRGRWNRSPFQVLFAGAMCPGVVVVNEERPSLELWGWEMKGHPLPQELLLPTADGVKALRLDKPGTLLPAGGLAEKWLCLRGGPTNALVVLERRPEAIEWRKSRHGTMELAIVFEGHKIYFAEEYDPHECETVRAAVVNLPADAKLDAAACSWWAKVLRQYPVSCSQVVLKRPDGRQECRLKYNYYRLGDEGDPAITAAPVPMLASFAMEHRFPGLEVPNAKETGYRSQYAAYRVVEGTDTLTYIAPPVDRAKVMKGVGELFAKRDEKSNTHAWGDEAAMFRRMADWGFDHCRYAFAFQADWDLPLCRSMAGPILEDNEAMWNRLDQVVKRCNDAGMQMMLTWFSDTGTRRWKDYPAEQRNCYELWRRIARRYSHLPDWAVSYDFFNEPAQMNTGHFNQVMKELTAVVRSEDKRHLIVWESGDGWAQPHWCLWMQPVKDDNVLYSFHHYGKHWGYAYDEYYPGYQATRERTQIEPWLEAILFSIKHNVPIHCGEFGLSMIQPAGDGEQWLDDYLALFERFGIGWNWWNYSGQDIYRTGLIARDRLSPYVPILTRWCRRSGWGQTRRAAARKK